MSGAGLLLCLADDSRCRLGKFHQQPWGGVHERSSGEHLSEGEYDCYQCDRDRSGPGNLLRCLQVFPEAGMTALEGKDPPRKVRGGFVTGQSYRSGLAWKGKPREAASP